MSFGSTFSSHVLDFLYRSGVDQKTATTATTATFVTALVFNAAVFGIEIGLFTVLRPYFKQIYEPRTQVPIEKYVHLLPTPSQLPLTFFFDPGTVSNPLSLDF